MTDGPIINYTKKNQTTRDTLGIENVATSIQGEICPIVNIVTPKPYYWAFIDWCFYDWYSNNPGKETRKDVYKYIRKVNYFIALGNILAGRYFGGSYTGSQKINNVYTFEREKEEFDFDENYIKGLSNMNYYLAGLDSMGMIITSNENTEEVYNEPKIREKDGKILALAFDKIISQTEYYKNYRFKDVAVPKDVLIELGKTINYNLDKFDECKMILRDNLFEKKSRIKLKECTDFINYIKKTFNIDLNNLDTCRLVLYDYFSPRGKSNQIDDNLKNISLEWEFVIGRQYLTAGLKVLWKYMLEQLDGLYTKDDWFKKCFDNKKFGIDLNAKLDKLFDSNALTADEIEKIVDLEKRYKNTENSIEHCIQIMLTIYSRFINRNDIEERFYHYGENREALSMKEIFECIDTFRDKPIKEFIMYVMDRMLLQQHMKTAFTKMLNDRDGYYIEEIDNQYIKKQDFKVSFQGIRLVELYSVMKDLGVLYV